MGAEDEYEINVRPEILLLEETLDPLGKGELRVPAFQRPFVWRPQQILDLFDSIERGYSIGSLLLWETDLGDLESLDRIGDLEVPPPDPERRTAYVLDGHQRLSALYATLRRPATARRSTQQSDWMWWPYRVLGPAEDSFNRYRHWKQQTPPPANYLPMRSVLRTRDFLAYARNLEERATRDMDVDRLVREAEFVAQRIKSYKLSVTRLVGGSLSNAVEMFSRVNSTGTPMRPAQMVSALTYRKSGQVTLADRLDAMVGAVADTGFGDVSSDALFRAVLAIEGEANVQEARWDVLAKRLDDVQVSADATEEALFRAVEFLRDVLRVPLARLVPYDAQLMLMTTFFHLCPHPDRGQVEELERWFWLTSWSGFFAGANSTTIKLALEGVRRFAHGHSGITPPDLRPRPFPDRFDLRSARVRAYLLWELQTFGRRVDTTGSPIDPVGILAKSATSAYRQVIMQPGLAIASSPANRLIMPTPPRTSVRNALLNLPKEHLSRVLTSHGVEPDAWHALRAGDGQGFIERRRRFLAEEERRFMEQFGVYGGPAEFGEADIDTE